MERNQFTGKTHGELVKMLQEQDFTPRELREMHKELRKYKAGIPLLYRYPDFPLVISIIALLCSILVPIVRLFLEKMI